MQPAAASRPRTQPSLGKMFLFGSGDLYSGAINVYSFFYALFVTDVIRLDPIFAGIVWLISQLWDAVLDPIAGYLSDMTRSRWGRRRIYFLVGMAPIFISFFMMWFPVQLASTGMKFTYVLVASIVFKSVYSMVMVPYQAMKAEFTMDYGQRNRLALMGMIFSSIATAAAFVLPAALTQSLGGTIPAYMYMAVIMGVFFMLPWPLVLHVTKGMDKFPPASRGLGDFFRSTVVPFRFKSFRRLAAMFITTVAAIDIISITFVYFINYYLMTSSGGFSYEELAVPIGGALLVQAVVVPLYNLISKRTGKHIAFITGCVLWAAGCGVIFMLQPLSTGSMWSLLPLGVLMGGGISGAMIMTSSMLTDMGEVGELYFKERKEGIFSGIVLLLRKASAALNNFFFLAFLGIAGYIAPMKQIVEGKEALVNQTQPEAVVWVIRIFVALVPAFFIILGIIAAVKYPLGARLHRILSYYLEKKRAGMTFHPEAEKLLTGIVLGGKDSVPFNREVERKLVRLMAESTGQSEKLMQQHFNELAESKVKKRHPIFRVFWRLFWLGFPRHKVFGLESIPKDRPAAYVCNHAGAYGPIVMVMSFTRRFRPWVLSNTCFLKTIRGQLQKDFLKAKSRPGKFLMKILANIIGPLAILVLRAVEAIPVYPDARIVTTFNKSVQTLKDGINLVIFPENDTTFSEYTNDFSSGFVHIARKYYAETGKRLEFYPVYASLKYRTVRIGTPLTYEPEDEFGGQKDRIAAYLRDSVTKIAEEQKIRRTH